MVISGGWLYLAIILLAVWFAFLFRIFWKLLRAPKPETGPYETLRSQLSVAGMGFAAVAVGALLFLNLTWTSVEISQYLGSAVVRILLLSLFFPSVLGFLFSSLGSGKMRFLGVGTALLTGFVWFVLVMVAAVSMGPSIARHPSRFLIPDGYVGWVEVKYRESNAPPLPMNNGTLIYRIPGSGLLVTSSILEDGWAKDEYFYYPKNGSVRALKETGWGSGGMIWGGSNSTVEQYFYVGTEAQYHYAVTVNESRPFNESNSNRISP
jgi:hypothetical protein